MRRAWKAFLLDVVAHLTDVLPPDCHPDLPHVHRHGNSEFWPLPPLRRNCHVHHRVPRPLPHPHRVQASRHDRRHRRPRRRSWQRCRWLDPPRPHRCARQRLGRWRWLRRHRSLHPPMCRWVDNSRLLANAQSLLLACRPERID